MLLRCMRLLTLSCALLLLGCHTTLPGHIDRQHYTKAYHHLQATYTKTRGEEALWVALNLAIFTLAEGDTHRARTLFTKILQRDDYHTLTAIERHIATELLAYTTWKLERTQPPSSTPWAQKVAHFAQHYPDRCLFVQFSIPLMHYTTTHMPVCRVPRTALENNTSPAHTHQLLANLLVLQGPHITFKYPAPSPPSESFTIDHRQQLLLEKQHHVALWLARRLAHYGPKKRSLLHDLRFAGANMIAPIHYPLWNVVPAQLSVTSMPYPIDLPQKTVEKPASGLVLLEQWHWGSHPPRYQREHLHADYSS